MIERDDGCASQFKRKAAWKGIRLEHYRLQRENFPEHAPRTRGFDLTNRRG